MATAATTGRLDLRAALPPESKMLHDGGARPILAKPRSREEWLDFCGARPARNNDR
jgi:hypothetical protein